VYNTGLQARFVATALLRQLSLVCALCGMLAVPSLSIGAETFGGEELKDPTRPAGAQVVVGAAGGAGFISGLLGSANGLLNSNYKVTFIRAGGTDPVAMINEKLVKTGDMIGEAEVISIDAQSVSLRVNGSIRRVTSYESTMRTPAQPL
jgi:hypothetical protein